MAAITGAALAPSSLSRAAPSKTAERFPPDLPPSWTSVACKQSARRRVRLILDPAGRPSRFAASASMASAEPSSAVRVVKVPAVPVTPENFARFGTVVLPGEDGAEYGAEDARLDLSQGTPRVYIMRLRDRQLGFDRITHHASVTQCLGAAGGGTWYLGVCPASVVEPAAPGGSPPKGAVQSKAGHWFLPPRMEDLVVLKVEGPSILKLHAGTWHAGPLFTAPHMDFFNLELADTNVVDHTTHVFSDEDGVTFAFDP